MKRPRKEYLSNILEDKCDWDRYEEHLNKYIDYLEAQIKKRDELLTKIGHQFPHILIGCNINYEFGE